MEIKLEDLVSEKVLGERLNLCGKTIKNRVAAGLLPLPVRLPGSSRSYFLRTELETWLGENVRRRPQIGEDPRRGPKTKARLRAEREAGLLHGEGK